MACLEDLRGCGGEGDGGALVAGDGDLGLVCKDFLLGDLVLGGACEVGLGGAGLGAKRLDCDNLGPNFGFLIFEPCSGFDLPRGFGTMGSLTTPTSELRCAGRAISSSSEFSSTVRDKGRVNGASLSWLSLSKSFMTRILTASHAELRLVTSMSNSKSLI